MDNNKQDWWPLSAAVKLALVKSWLDVMTGLRVVLTYEHINIDFIPAEFMSEWPLMNTSYSTWVARIDAIRISTSTS